MLLSNSSFLATSWHRGVGAYLWSVNVLKIGRAKVQVYVVSSTWESSAANKSACDARFHCSCTY